jgi:hypothetical protein
MYHHKKLLNSYQLFAYYSYDGVYQHYIFIAEKFINANIFALYSCHVTTNCHVPTGALDGVCAYFHSNTGVTGTTRQAFIEILDCHITHCNKCQSYIIRYYHVDDKYQFIGLEEFYKSLLYNPEALYNHDYVISANQD